MRNIKPRLPIKFLVLDVDGVLTDGGIYLTERGDVFKKFNVKDGVAIQQLVKSGIDVGFISSAKKSKKLLKTRAKMLGVKFVYSGDKEKLSVLSKWCAKLKIDFKEVSYIGDDINDLKVISTVGFSACPADAVTQIKKAVNVVLRKKGGEACVREFIDLYLL
jgi:3-deoxy-D-manno-octulosonate 8-phosphate phosphatase (KDO 8-P phosphatase)